MQKARVWGAPSATGSRVHSLMQTRSHTGPRWPGAQDSWLQVSLEVQLLMQVTMGFGDSGVWKVGTRSTVSFSIFTGFQSPREVLVMGNVEKRDFAPLFCCSGFVARTELACSRCVLFAEWMIAYRPWARLSSVLDIWCLNLPLLVKLALH